MKNLALIRFCLFSSVFVCGCVTHPRYMVVDLTSNSTGDSCAVSYLSEAPESGWTDEYKTDKLVLRWVAPGEFVMGSPKDEFARFEPHETQHGVVLSKGFWIGVFKCTQAQWKNVMGENSGGGERGKMPKARVSYVDLRGNQKGLSWPEVGEVDESSFFGALQAKTGLKFDLPTDAQWEYACRAGTTNALYNGASLQKRGHDESIDCLARHFSPSPVPVGSLLPNPLGLYDMYGNGWEWIRDRCVGDLGTARVVDPVGPAVGDARVARSCGWGNNAYCCRSANRHFGDPKSRYFDYGFRIGCEE